MLSVELFVSVCAVINPSFFSRAFAPSWVSLQMVVERHRATNKATHLWPTTAAVGAGVARAARADGSGAAGAGSGAGGAVAGAGGAAAASAVLNIFLASASGMRDFAVVAVVDNSVGHRNAAAYTEVPRRIVNAPH